MSYNTQQEQLEMGNRRSRSPAHELATQDVAPKPDAGLNNDNSNSSDNQIDVCKPFVADALNTERRVVLQLREGCGLKKQKKNKMHQAFQIFNVATNVASFCPLPPFELKDELLETFEDYIFGGEKMSKVEPLSTADQYALSRVTTVGDCFLYRCTDLKRIDLSPLSNVTTVGNHFLAGCSGIKIIDLSALSSVTRIGDSFLQECSGLKTINLSPLSNLTRIGNLFLSECHGLYAIDLSPLSNVTTGGYFFLFNCDNLNTVAGVCHVQHLLE